MEVTEGDDDDTVVAVAAIMLPKFRHTLPAAPRSVAAPRSLASPSMAAARYQPVLVPWLLLVPRLIGKRKKFTVSHLDTTAIANRRRGHRKSWKTNLGIASGRPAFAGQMT